MTKRKKENIQCMASIQFKEDKLSILWQAHYNINFRRMNQYSIDEKPLYVVKTRVFHRSNQLCLQIKDDVLEILTRVFLDSF